jgi:hypothetical protein
MVEALLHWLFLPIDATRVHDVSSLIAWHGRVMTLAWGFAVPIGVILARYFKILPRQNWPHELDNKVWWHSHLSLHYLAGLLTLLGIALVLQGLVTIGNSGTHAVFGWALVLLALGQFMGGWLRGSKGGPTDRALDGSLHGDHYSMTRRRVIFEYAHKGGGYLALCMACGAILSGLWRANAPHWMWLMLLFWWGFLITLAFNLQRKGRAFDTYQAIWGPDPNHPGNARKPIGLGTNRPKEGKAHS